MRAGLAANIMRWLYNVDGRWWNQRRGHVGTTDELGIAAVERPFHVKHLHATILNRMGIDRNKLSYSSCLDQNLSVWKHIDQSPRSWHKITRHLAKRCNLRLAIGVHGRKQFVNHLDRRRANQHDEDARENKQHQRED